MAVKSKQSSPSVEVFEAQVADAFESVDVTEAATGVLKGVKLLGLRSRNGKSYDTQGVRDTAVSRLNGARVYVDHPTDAGKTRDYKDAFGFVQEGSVEYRAGKGYYGTLRWNPSHPLASQFAWDVANTPKNLGMSINGRIKPGRRNAQGDVVVEAIDEIRSVDLVTRPATANGIFESEGRDEDSLADTEESDMTKPAAGDVEALEAVRKENEALAARLKEATEALESIRKEQAAKAVRAEVDKVLADAFEGTQVPADLLAEVAECACQMCEKTQRDGFLKTVSKFGPLFEDDGRDITAESEQGDADDSGSVKESVQKPQKKAPAVGSRGAAKVASGYKLHDRIAPFLRSGN
jgi:hypothetical protein